MPSKKQQARNQQAAERRAAMKWAVESITPEIILAITCIVLGAAVTMLVLTSYGFRLGEKAEAERLSNGEANSSNVSIINIDYEAKTINYDADQSCISGTSEEKCLLYNYGVKNSNYAVISSKDQLNRLMSSLKGITGKDYDPGIDPSIFNAGSVIAISALEGSVDFSLTSVYRDENYGLHFQTRSVYTDTALLPTGNLILVSISNIQTKNITVTNVTY